MNRKVLFIGMLGLIAVFSIGCGTMRHSSERDAEGKIVKEETKYSMFFQKVKADDYASTVTDGGYSRTVGVKGAQASGDAQMMYAGANMTRQAVQDGMQFAQQAFPGYNVQLPPIRTLQPASAGVTAAPVIGQGIQGASGVIVTNASGARFMLLDPGAADASPPAIGAPSGPPSLEPDPPPSPNPPG